MTKGPNGSGDYQMTASMVPHRVHCGLSSCISKLKEYKDRINWGHSTFEHAIAAANRAGVKKLALYHHDPDRTDSHNAPRIGSLTRRTRGPVRSTPPSRISGPRNPVVAGIPRFPARDLPFLGRDSSIERGTWFLAALLAEAANSDPASCILPAWRKSRRGIGSSSS